MHIYNPNKYTINIQNSSELDTLLKHRIHFPERHRIPFLKGSSETSITTNTSFDNAQNVAKEAAARKARNLQRYSVIYGNYIRRIISCAVSCDRILE